MSKLIRIACLAMIGAAGSAAYAGGQQETTAAVAGDGQVRKAADEQAAAQRRPAPAQRGMATPGVVTPGPSDNKPQQVTVTGTRANDTEQRQMFTASKMIFGREELDRNGDTSVGDILKRLPGVTMGGAP